MAKRRLSKNTDRGAGYYWMNTYGDLVTLLLCFFVFLFASSNPDKNKFELISMSLSGAIPPIAFALDPGPANLDEPLQMYATPRVETEASPPPQTASTLNITPTPKPQDAIDASFRQLYRVLQEYFDAGDGMDEIDVSQQEHYIVLNFKDSIFFDSGRSDLKQEAYEIIDSFVPFFEDYANVIKTIRIEGHTDNLPIRTSQFKNNWWLSSSRALTVLDYLTSVCDIHPDKLGAEGRGEWQPIDTNDTEEGRARNRRVEFLIEEVVVSTVDDSAGG